MKVEEMHQSKDPAIKLFGRKIPVPGTEIPASFRPVQPVSDLKVRIHEVI